MGLKVTQDQGVLIVRVVPNSPAQQAGLEPGDIIQKVGGKPIKTASDVQEEVEASEVGVNLDIEVNRQGKTKMILVKPGAFPLNQLD